MVNFWLQHDVTGHPAAECSVRTADRSPYEFISTTLPWVSQQAPLLLYFNKFWVLCFCFLFLFCFFLNKSSTAWTGFESCCIGETELRRLLPTACTSQVLELQTLPPPASVLLFFWRNFPKRLVFNNCGMKWKLSLSVSVQRNVFFFSVPTSETDLIFLGLML